MTTETPITTLPQGYTPTTNNRGDLTCWGLWRTRTRSRLSRTRISYLLSRTPPALKRDLDGNVVWEKSGPLHMYEGNTFEPIPDSQHPAEGMTYAHTHFNTETQKWERPEVSHKAHAVLEQRADNDVAAALDAFCAIEADMEIVAIFRATLASEALARVTERLNKVHDCFEERITHNADHALAAAWLMSHDIFHQSHEGDGTEFTKATEAQEFAAAYLKALNAKTATERGSQPKYIHILKLFQELKADAKREGSARLLPEAVKVVETLSTPADSTEITAEALFQKIKTAVRPPSEGA